MVRRKMRLATAVFATLAWGRVSDSREWLEPKRGKAMAAANQLKTMVSDETKAKFDEKRKELGLSTNQFLKLLVLVAVGEPSPDVDDDLSDDEVHDVLVEWLRGK